MGDDIDDEYFDFSASNGEEIVADLIDSEGLSAKSGFQVNEGDATLSLKDNDAELSTSTGKRRAELKSGEEEETSQKKKKKKKKDKPPSAQSNSQLLITTGRTITSRPLPAHCAFFNAAYLPTLAEAGFQGVEGLTVDKFVGTPIQSTTKIEDLDSQFLSFLRLHLLPPHKGGNKRLKNWRSPSPLATIISSSAKRSCEILKILKGLNVRVGKLFSKNMKKEDQIAMLTSNAYPICCGTPSRILALLEHGALSFEKTELVVMDCKEDGKGFNVITLKDTRGEVCRLVKGFVEGVEGCKISLY
ncbi:hypothetical protein TrST_g811 [Triparma strigata]|uniref:Uncharacterized protein n=1 Tax=Triparma strigata TaxID=1606541 RepID=A0A9W7B6A4_9STRA|nr:hypothetical protein TrST_g811 [Triparma strigata]